MTVASSVEGDVSSEASDEVVDPRAEVTEDSQEEVVFAMKSNNWDDLDLGLLPVPSGTSSSKFKDATKFDKSLAPYRHLALPRPHWSLSLYCLSHRGDGLRHCRALPNGKRRLPILAYLHLSC